MSFYLFNKLQSFKIKYEHFIFQNHQKHLLPQLYIFDLDIVVEGNLGSVFFLMVIPNDHFIFLISEYKNNDIGFVHHLNEFDFLSQELTFLL